MRLKKRPFTSRLFAYQASIYFLYALWAMLVAPLTKESKALVKPNAQALRRERAQRERRIRKASQLWILRAGLCVLLWGLGWGLFGFYAAEPVFEATGRDRPSDQGVAVSDTGPIKNAANRSGFLAFGPFLTLPSGLYRFEMTYQFTGPAAQSSGSYWDIIAAPESGLTPLVGLFTSSPKPQRLIRWVFLSGPTPNIEFRAYYARDGKLAIQDTKITRHGPRADIYQSRRARYSAIVIGFLLLADGALALATKGRKNILGYPVALLLRLIALTFLRPMHAMKRYVRLALTQHNVIAFAQSKRRKRTARWAALALALFLVTAPTTWFIQHYSQDFYANAWLDAAYPGLMIRHRQAREIYGTPYAASALLREAALGVLTTNKNTPSININIDFKSYQSLKAQRDKAVKAGVKMAEATSYVPAVIDFEGQKLRAKLRLKGDLADHWSDDKKWSFKIKMKNSAFMGMTLFSIQAPWTRNFQVEPLYFKTLRDLGVLTPKYFFVRAAVNGQDIGVMAVEENFSKTLLESQERKDGPILKINEDLRWKYVLIQMNADPEQRQAIDQEFKAFESANSFVFEAINAPIPHEAETAMALMRAVVERKMPPSAVFDVDLWGKYLANALLWGASHDTVWTNLRLYYNPITGKIEPIAYDAGITDLSDYAKTIASYYPQHLDRLFYGDPVLMKSIKHHIAVLAAKYNAPTYTNELQKFETERLNDLRHEFRLLPRFSLASHQKTALVRAQQILEDRFFLPVTCEGNEPTISKNDGGRLYANPAHALPAMGLAFLMPTATGYNLGIKNILEADLKIESAQCWVNDSPIICSQLFNATFPFVLKGTSAYDVAPQKNFALRPQPADSAIKIELTASVGEKRSVITTQPYVDTAQTPLLQPMRLDKLRRAYPAFAYDKATHTLSLNNQKLTIKDYLILPEGIQLIITNSDLRFAPQAGLYIRGAVRMTASSLAPLDPQGTWRGLTVMQANLFTPGVRSRLDKVQIEKTTFAESGAWNTTGGTVFNQSDVDLINTTISGAQSEDAINIIRSTFTMDGTTMTQTRSDGFDSDFSTGNIRNSAFLQTGGDGLDLSGSTITLANTLFEHNHDKAVSVGEASQAFIESIRVRSSTTGLASKDSSTTHIKKSSFENIERAVLMAYVKKPEYGGGQIIAENITFDDKDDAIIAQKKSKISLNGKNVKTRKIDIDALYKEGYMKK